MEWVVVGEKDAREEGQEEGQVYQDNFRVFTTEKR